MFIQGQAKGVGFGPGKQGPEESCLKAGKKGG